MRVNRGTPYRVDQNMKPIAGGSRIADVLNVAVTNGAWTPIPLGSALDMACKVAVCQMRAGGAWQLSHLASGLRYFTVGAGAPITIEIAKDTEEILFYVNPTVTGTFEAILID